MLRRILQTEDSWALLILRVTLAVVLLPHGAQKLFGWFGGPGFDVSMSYFTERLGVPWVVGLLVLLVESVGALALALGLMGRVWAAGIGAVMLGAAVLQLRPGLHHFLAVGFEYRLLAVAISAALVIAGSGKWSADRLLARRL
jgi:putative oxidoreductase